MKFGTHRDIKIKKDLPHPSNATKLIQEFDSKGTASNVARERKIDDIFSRENLLHPADLGDSNFCIRQFAGETGISQSYAKRGPTLSLSSSHFPKLSLSATKNKELNSVVEH